MDKMTYPGHSLEFTITIPNTSRIWDNEKCILYDDKLSLDWEREPNQFFFRPKLNGRITIIGELARAVYEMDKDSYATLTMREKLVQINNYPEAPSTFNKAITFRFGKSACNIKTVIAKYVPGSEGENITSNYVIEISPEPEDIYTDILNNIDKEYDLIKLMVPRSTVGYQRRPCLQLYIQNTDYLGHFLGGNYWETEVSNPAGMLAANKHFARVFGFRSIRIKSNLPPSAGVDIEGDYYADFTNPSVDFPDRLSPTPNRYDYRLYRNNDPSTKSALHIYLWGGQANQTLEIKHSWNINTVANPIWVDDFTIVEGKPAPDGYDYAMYGDPYLLLSGNTTTFITADPDVTAIQTDKEYYGRWYLPTSSFGDRQTYEKPADDPTINGDIIGYKYISPAVSGDVSVVIGVQNLTPGEWGMNDDGQYFHPPVDSNNYAPLLMSSWDYVSFWIIRSSFSSNTEVQGREVITIDDAYLLKDVLKYLFEAARTNGNSVIPLYDIEFASMGQNWSGMFVTPKSNIVRGLYTLAAQKAPTTLGEYLDLVRNMFNLYWYIDIATATIVFKTRQDLMSDSGRIDLSDPEGSQNPRGKRSWGYGSQTLQFDRSELPERQQFKWMDKSTDVFNYPILINQGALVKPDESDEVSFGNFTADVDYMVISGNECSLDGFAIFVASFTQHEGKIIRCVLISGVDYLGATYSVSNGDLSIPELTGSLLSGLNQERPTSTYKWLYDTDGTIHQASIAYSATQQLKIPVPLIDYADRVTAITDLSSWAYKQILTNFHFGRIRKMSVNVISRIATLTIEQRPE